MSAPDRREMLDRVGRKLSIRRQCALLGVARSGVYRARKRANDSDLSLMRWIDELFTSWPFLGSRRMTAMLRAEGFMINRKRVQRLMRQMGIAALGPKPKTTKPAPGHKIYPYLLRNVTIERANHVWAADITYIPITLSRGDHRLGEPGGSRVAAVKHAGHIVLPRRARRRLCAVRQTGDIQHRSGLAVHFGRLHRRARGERHRDLHGRPRALDGQCLHRALVAVVEARRRLSQRLCRRPRGEARHRGVDGVLQRAAPASGARLPPTDGALARRDGERESCGHDGQRSRVDHMSTAATDTAFGCMIKGRRSGRAST
jgi:HTH-like domain